MTFEEWYGQHVVIAEAAGTFLDRARNAWNTATTVEREACAQTCEDLEKEIVHPEECAAAIRERSNG